MLELLDPTSYSGPKIPDSPGGSNAQPQFGNECFTTLRTELLLSVFLTGQERISMGVTCTEGCWWESGG